MVSFQNGVVKDDVLRRILGAEHVIGGVCYIAATIAEPGVIRHSGTLQKLVFGEYDGTPSARVHARSATPAVDGGIDVEISDRIEQTIWEKFVFLVGLSGTTSIDAHARSARSASTPALARVPARPDGRGRAASRAPRAWRCPRTTPTTGSPSSTGVRRR